MHSANSDMHSRRCCLIWKMSLLQSRLFVMVVSWAHTAAPVEESNGISTAMVTGAATQVNGAEPAGLFSCFSITVGLLVLNLVGALVASCRLLQMCHCSKFLTSEAPDASRSHCAMSWVCKYSRTMAFHRNPPVIVPGHICLSRWPYCPFGSLKQVCLHNCARMTDL